MVLYGVIGIGGQPLKNMGGGSTISDGVIKQLVILNPVPGLTRDLVRISSTGAAHYREIPTRECSSTDRR